MRAIIARYILDKYFFALIRAFLTIADKFGFAHPW